MLHELKRILTGYKHGQNRPSGNLKAPISPRALTKVVDYMASPAEITYSSLKEWHASKMYVATHEYFGKYPANSLLGEGIGRELLYHFIRSMKPEVVIEVGTYRAGTSEVMTRALWENGKGILHTTDPFGAERCPGIIACWPADLQKHVRYYAQNSMDFFASLDSKNTVIDIALIDGNHDFEYAYFDLACAAKMVRPGGIIVLDNIEQPGPFWAGIEFLRQNPEWTEIGESINNFSADNPFDPNRKLFGTDFLVLKAPNYFVVKSIPNATGQRRYSGSELTGIRLTMSRPSHPGTLHAQVFLRGFSNGLDPEQLVSTTTVALDGNLSCDILLPKPLSTKFTRMGVEYYHTVECVLFWQPKGRQDPLYLQTVPTPFGNTGHAH